MSNPLGTRWLQTRSGARYDLDTPEPHTIVLGDVVFSLAHLNRFTGHAGPYSVAQHSCLAAETAHAWGCSDDVQRAALMHDAHEAYVGDVASPIKRCLGDVWTRFERKHSDAVRSRFALPRVNVAIVGTIDLALLMTEKRDLLGPEPEPWGIDVEPLLERIFPWAPSYAIDRFLRLASTLEIR